MATGPNPSKHKSHAHLAGKPAWVFTTILLLTAGLVLFFTLAVMLGLDGLCFDG
ncbi:UNVERIFIED_CONTAM: hypothetical protein ABIC26_000868 [Paenibacillus sp. PvR008]